MRSDNGTNFIGVERELKGALNEWNLSQIQNAMLQINIDWRFNPPAGSHFGGVLDRLIRCVRKSDEVLFENKFWMMMVSTSLCVKSK